MVAASARLVPVPDIGGMSSVTTVPFHIHGLPRLRLLGDCVHHGGNVRSDLQAPVYTVDCRLLLDRCAVSVVDRE